MYLDSSYSYSKIEKITPWLGADTAKHYQWYPFINVGHYELAKQLKDKRRISIEDIGIPMPAGANGIDKAS